MNDKNAEVIKKYPDATSHFKLRLALHIRRQSLLYFYIVYE